VHNDQVTVRGLDFGIHAEMFDNSKEQVSRKGAKKIALLCAFASFA